MYSSNSKINAINSILEKGFDITFRKTSESKSTVVSVLKDRKEIIFFIDKTIDKKNIEGTALNSFVEKVQEGFFDREIENG